MVQMINSKRCDPATIIACVIDSCKSTGVSLDRYQSNPESFGTLHKVYTIVN